MNLRRFGRAYLLGIKTSNDRPYSKAVFSGFTRSFKKTREQNLNILVQS